MGKSDQAGWVSLRGKRWFGYFRQTVIDPESNEERVKRVCVKLALKSKMTKGRSTRCAADGGHKTDWPESRRQGP